MRKAPRPNNGRGRHQWVLPSALEQKRVSDARHSFHIRKTGVRHLILFESSLAYASVSTPSLLIRYWVGAFENVATELGRIQKN